MKAKKNKDLESELVNDLLDDLPSLPSADLDEPSAVVPLRSAKDSSGDETVKLSESQVLPSRTKYPKTETQSTLNLSKGTQTGIRDKFAIRGGKAGGSGVEASLALSENLRIAQQRIFELEQEIERLRVENEQLAAAGETIRKRSDELQADNDFKSKKMVDLKERLESEREILENSLKARDRELKDLQLKNQEFEMRLSTNLQKIRVRERELENRLELIKMESTAVVRSKDEMILELKRQLDQLSAELENYRTKGQELHRQLVEKQEMQRRTVKALRLALSMLEGGADDPDGYKKAT